MSDGAAVRPARWNTPALTVGGLAWCALGGLFIALRLGAALGTPPGGAELDGLAGAWQAHVGSTDSRYIPTLFQALTALSFQWTTSELPARLLAVVVTGTVPFAVYRLRPWLGEAGALFSLALLTFDAPGVLLGATATASGFDIPVTIWLGVLLHERRAPAWAWAPAGFLVATAGPTWLPLALGVGAARLFRQEYPATRTLAFGAAGAASGVLAASLRFGMGWDGFRVPPFDALAAGFDGRWSTESTGYLAALYLAPLLAAGLAAVVYDLFRANRGEELMAARVESLTWAGLAAGWLLTSAGSHSPVPLAGVSVPVSLLLGPSLARLTNAAWSADWTYARFLVPGALVCLLVAAAFTLQWARDGRAADSGEKLAVGGLVVVAAGAAALVALDRRSRPALAVPAAAIGILPLVSGLSGVAFSLPNEPLPSPVSPFQAREIRDIALRFRTEEGGLIVIHPRLERDLTWAFRDSGELIVASGSVPDASVVIWPADLAAPEGYSVLDGEWAVLRERQGPDADFLDYLRWLANRNTLPTGRVPVTVYLKAGP